MEPTAGEILFNGRDLLSASEAEMIDIRRHKMGMVFQHFALLPHLTVLDNVAFPLDVQGLGRAEREDRARKMIALVGLAGREGAFPRQLSGGQQQRVGIARSLAVEPELWFLDEPFSALDPLIRREMQDEFIRLQSVLKKTIVFITHDFDEAIRLADRIAVMKDGILQQIDTPQHLYDHPSNVFVAGFIGSPSMNFFDATLAETDGKLEINAGGFRLEVPEQKAKEWRQFKGREVIFGVRPEDIHAKPYVPPGILESDLQSRVDVTELMGNEIFLYLMTRDDKQYIARVDPRVRTEPGDELDLAVNMENAHIFDPKTEISLAG